MLKISRDSASFIKTVIAKESYEVADIKNLCLQFVNDPASNPDRIIDAFVLTVKDLNRKQDMDLFLDSVSRKHVNTNIILLAKKKAENIPGVHTLLDPKKETFFALLDSFKVEQKDDTTGNLESNADDLQEPKVEEVVQQAPPIQTPQESFEFNGVKEENTVEQQVQDNSLLSLDNLTLHQIIKKLSIESAEYKNLTAELGEINKTINSILYSEKTSIEKKDLINKSVAKFLKVADSKGLLLGSYAYNIIKSLADAFSNEVTRKFNLTSSQINRLEAVNITGLKSAELDALMASKIRLIDDLNNMEAELVSYVNNITEITSDVSNAIVNIASDMDISAQKYAVDQMPYNSTMARTELKGYLDKLEELGNANNIEEMVDKIHLMKAKLEDINNKNDMLLDLSDKYIKHLQTQKEENPTDSKIHVIVSNLSRGNFVVPEILGIGSERIHNNTLIINFTGDMSKFKSEGKVVEIDNNLEVIPVEQLLTLYSDKMNMQEDVNLSLLNTILEKTPDIYKDIIIVCKAIQHKKLIETFIDRIYKVSLAISVDKESITWLGAKMKALEELPKIQKQLILNEVTSTDTIEILRQSKLDSMVDLKLRVIPHFDSFNGQVLRGESIMTPELDKFLKELSYGI